MSGRVTTGSLRHVHARHPGGTAKRPEWQERSDVAMTQRNYLGEVMGSGRLSDYRQPHQPRKPGAN